MDNIWVETERLVLFTGLEPGSATAMPLDAFWPQQKICTGENSQQFCFQNTDALEPVCVCLTS